MPDTKQVLKYLKLNEDKLSIVLGSLVVVVLGLFLFNFFRDRNPSPTPQISQQAANTQTPEVGQVPQGLESGHTVAAGDTLWDIAEARYGSGYNWVDIAEANKLKNPGVLTEGQQLALPQVAAKVSTVTDPEGDIIAVVTPTQEVTPTPLAVVTPEPQAQAPQTIGADTYTTVQGDHLWGIAVRAYGDGYQWVRIWRANKLADPNLIFVGQTLTIPRDGTK